MTKPKLLAVCFSLLIAGGVIAAKAPATAPQYDYVSLHQSPNFLTVADTQDKYEVRSVKEEIRGRLTDFRPILKKITEYEAQGYERVETTLFASEPGFMTYYALLRKVK